MDNMINLLNEEKVFLIVLCNNLIYGVLRKGWSLVGFICGSSFSSRRIMNIMIMGVRSLLFKFMVFSLCIIFYIMGNRNNVRMIWMGV